ncbi:MAG: GatB/YqeY domain-containing protein [bacterium]
MTISDLRTHLKQSMLQKDSDRTSVLRMLLAAISYFAMSKNKKDDELTEDDVNEVILKEVKTRRETIEEFEAANDVDRATKEKSELIILEEYAPKLMSNEEILLTVKEILASSDPNIMVGPAMGLVMRQLKGKADPASIQNIVKQVLAK